MTANVKSWILTDTDKGIWREKLDLRGSRLGVPGCARVRIRKTVLRGGLRDGVDLIEVDNGAFSFFVVPTRGMGLWRGRCGDVSLGWASPVRGPVHPAYVNLSERSGLGWLGGFDEWVVRCGLESNGAPGADVLPSNTGAPTSVPLTLHGRIANRPAHEVEIRVLPGKPPVIEVLGAVDEATMFGPQFRLRTRLSTAAGSKTLSLSDEVVNLGATAAEMELLYHCNYGAPLLEGGGRFVAPLSATLPRDARAAEDIETWAGYREPTTGYVEQCYWHVPLADAKGNTLALLRNREGTRGTAVRYNVRQLPCLTQWKNTGALADGYVTGIEPGVNFPNPRAFERRRGRVIRLEAGASYRADLAFEVADSAVEVKALEKEIAALQGGRPFTLHRKPDPTFSPID